MCFTLDLQVFLGRGYSYVSLILPSISLQNAGTEKSIFPLPEPQDVFLSSQVKFDDLSKDLRKMYRDLTGKNYQKQSQGLQKRF